MCVVSMITDHYREKWDQPGLWPLHDPIPTWPYETTVPLGPTKQQFDDLKKEVLEMKELLKRALKYDADNNEPHCEMDEKVKLVKEVASAVGVSLEDIFPDEEK